MLCFYTCAAHRRRLVHKCNPLSGMERCSFAPLGTGLSFRPFVSCIGYGRAFPLTADCPKNGTIRPSVRAVTRVTVTPGYRGYRLRHLAYTLIPTGAKDVAVVRQKLPWHTGVVTVHTGGERPIIY